MMRIYPIRFNIVNGASDYINGYLASFTMQASRTALFNFKTVRDKILAK